LAKLDEVLSALYGDHDMNMHSTIDSYFSATTTYETPDDRVGENGERNSSIETPQKHMVHRHSTETVHDTRADPRSVAGHDRYSDVDDTKVAAGTS
jgi:hypothetical protein